MPTIDLMYFENVGLIIKRPSGVLYHNQIAGYACLQAEIEGEFCPLPVKPGKSEMHALSHHCSGSSNPLTEDDAQIVDGILHRNGHAISRSIATSSRSLIKHGSTY